LSRVYTRSGDEGYTWCSRSKSRVPKTHPCIEFVGALDEAEAALGLARSLLRAEQRDIAELLLWIEELLFRIGFTFAGSKECITYGDLEALERLLDAHSGEVEPVFTVTPSYAAAAAISLARAVTRRAERRYWACLEALAELRDTDRLGGKLLNRISDLLYVLQLIAAKKAGEKPPQATCSGSQQPPREAKRGA